MATSQEIIDFLAANPNMSDSDIAYNMMQYGVSPEQVIQATGMSPTQGMQRFGAALTELGVPQPGLQGREQASRAGLQSALAALAASTGQARGDIEAGRDLATQQAREGFGQAQGFYQPFTEGGRAAFNQQLALSGAMGREAFDQANQQSPYVNYLQEEGERAVTRNAAALGGLRGGNVMLELQRRGQGLAGQGLQQQFQNLGQLSGMGLQSAGGQAGIASNQAQFIPGITMQAAGNLANIAQAGGQNAANMQFGAGQFNALGRTDAGNLLAGNQALTSQQLANLAQSQGAGLSDIYGQYSGNLANLLSGQGQNLAQIGMQGAGQYAGLSGIPGVQQTDGILSGIGQLASGTGAAMGGYAALRNL